MKEVLKLQTEQASVIVRTLSYRSDDVAYFEGIDEDRAHVDQFCNNVSEEYKTLADVTRTRLNSGQKIRMGIWDNEVFIGSINASPKEGRSVAEIGYWLRASATGKGYATFAVRALTAYLGPMFNPISADVHPINRKSSKVLIRSGYVLVGMHEREWGLAEVYQFVK